MTAEPVYYRPEAITEADLKSALTDVVSNFVAGVINGTIAGYGHYVKLEIKVRGVGPMDVVNVIHQIKVGDDGIYVDTLKVASSAIVTTGAAYVIVGALGLSAIPGIVPIAIAASIGVAVSALWDYQFAPMATSLIDQLFGTEDTKIEYVKNGQTVAGVFFPNLEVNTEPSQIRALLDHFNGEINPGLQEGDTIKVLKNDSIDTVYRVAKGDLLEIAAQAMGIDASTMDGYDGAQHRDGSNGKNSDVVARDGHTGYTVYNEDSALGLTAEIKGEVQNITIPIKNITWAGLLTATGGGSGLHVYFGGAGNTQDSITITASEDTLTFAGGGSDTVYGGTGDDTIYGDTSDKDSETGSNDELYGMGGDDYLYGGGGADKLFGGDGKDVLEGGYGEDRLSGNTINGDGGQDMASDTLRGGAGADIYTLNSTGYFGADNPAQEMDAYVYYMGDIGFLTMKTEFRCADIIDDDGDGDRIYIFDGYGYLDHAIVQSEERINGFDFYHTDIGLSYIKVGNDLCVAERTGPRIEPQRASASSASSAQWAGYDVIAVIKDYYTSGTMKYSITSTASVPGKYGVELAVAVTTYGDNGNNAIIGAEAPNYILSFEGDDTIETGRWNDHIYAGWGNDVVYSGGGHDTIDGDEGDDLIDAGDGDDIVIGGGGDDIIIGGAGNDFLYGDYREGETSGTIGGKDQIYGGEGDDYIDGGDGDEDWVTYWDANGVTVNLTDGTATGQGNDTIVNIENVWGSLGDDSITGNELDNELYGSEGNDFIWGVDGYNTMDGGSGDDHIVSGHGNDIIEGGEGNDTVEYWWSTSGVTVNLTTGTAYGDGDDTLSGIENVSGSSYDDSLTGNEDDNHIYGDLGDDALYGLAGNDYLNAGDGSDLLNGGAGDDYLVGGDGSDVFRFDPSFGHDTIEDFSIGDIIEFASSVFADFGDVLGAATEVDGNTIIAFDSDNSVTLQNVALASLSADEFRFAA